MAPPPRQLPPPTSAPNRPVRLKDVPGLIRHLPHHKPWLVALGAIAAVVVITTCSLGSYLLMTDDSAAVGTIADPADEVPLRDISSRKADPDELTAADIFPDAEIVADPAFPPYVRVGEPQVYENCKVAATGEVAVLLDSLDCSQVVRATFRSPDGNYLVTAGVFNLRDNTASVQAHDEIKALVADGTKGRFSGYIPDSDKSLRPLGIAPTSVSWDVRGHFLVYCVIARADGKEFEPDDAFVPVIVYDLVQKYLLETRLYEWSIDKAALSPTAGPTGSATADADAGAA